MPGLFLERMRLRSLAAGLLSCCAATCVASCVASWAVPGGAPEHATSGGEAPAEPFQVRLWRAGRAIPPGLSAARVGELEAERARAVMDLADGLEPVEETRLREWLAGEDTPDELWCAGARAVAALERYDLAPLLSAALEPSADARRAVAARATLHALYGRWFRGPSELAPYLASVARGAGTRLLLGSHRSEEARSRERLLAELAYRPASAAAWLADPDPEVRSGAARTLAQAFTLQGEGNGGGTLELLVAHLEGEYEPQAFHDGLQACFSPLERAGVDQPVSARLRALLVDIARTQGDERTLSAAQALARIPWRRDGPRDLGHVLSGVEALAAMLRGLAAADQCRGVNDPDPLVAVLSSLRQLCAQASTAGLGEELQNGEARASLFAVLVDPAQDEAVRAAAAAALGPLARVSDGPELATVLGDPAVGAQVKHALLGALSAILPELEPGVRGAEELLAALAAQTGASDSDLRRRALALCAEPRLEPLVRTLDPSFLLERIEHEEGREATLDLLRLIQRFGREDMLAELLALERFERLCSEPATLEALAAVLQRLAGREGRDVHAASARLAAVPSQETSSTRLRHALALVASLDDAQAFELEPEAHRAIHSWVWRVVRAGVAPRDIAPQGLVFEQRLLEVHLPRAAVAQGTADDGLGPFEDAHLSALLRADLFLGSSTGRGSKPQVENAFEGAYALASSAERRLLVLRDRARFRAAANECVKAMSDYRRLLEAGAPAEAMLGIPDLRSAVELLERLDVAGGDGPSGTAAEACELLGRIVARPSWRAEPAAVRMQDLRDWVRMALLSGEVNNLREVDAALADLPLTQLETQLEREPVPLWFGLTRDAGWFQELLDLRARTRIGVRELEARG